MYATVVGPLFHFVHSSFGIWRHLLQTLYIQQNHFNDHGPNHTTPRHWPMLTKVKPKQYYWVPHETQVERITGEHHLSKSNHQSLAESKKIWKLWSLGTA